MSRMTLAMLAAPLFLLLTSGVVNAGAIVCGDPIDNDAINASDALYVLRAAVGTQECTLFVCDANGNGSVTATDALLVLRVAVGGDDPLNCPVPSTTTTTTTTSSTSSTSTSSTTTSTTILITTTTTLPLPGTELKAVLNKTGGRFNYMAMPGLPGAEAQCDAVAAGTHVCTKADLLVAEAAGDLDGITDPTTSALVTSMWFVDPAALGRDQCAMGTSDAVPDTGPNWVYNTAHIANKGKMAPLNNATGDLGAETLSTNCNTQSWLGCCAD